MASNDKLSTDGLRTVWNQIKLYFVAKEAGKTLSDNNYSDTAVAEVAKIANKADKATTLSGYGITNAYTKSEIDTTVSGLRADINRAYKVKGSCAFAELPTADMSVGDMYNVTDAFTATNAFVTSERGKEYPAGTNVAYTENGWDAMSGIYDFSDFVRSGDLPTDITEAKIKEICVIS